MTSVSPGLCARLAVRHCHVDKPANLLTLFRNLADNKSVSEQQEIEDEYGSKADALEDRIEAMKSEKGLKNDFNNYLGRFMNAATTDREKPASKNKNARRATRA